MKILVIVLIVGIIVFGIYTTLEKVFYNLSFPISSQDKVNYTNLDTAKIGLKNSEEIDVIFSKKKDDLVFLYFHGNAGRTRSVIDFLSQNYSFVSPAYPGYHGSSGKPSVENIYETAEKMRHFISQNFPGRKVYVFGHSLGSQPAFYYGNIAENIKTLGIVAGFDGVLDLCRQKAQNGAFICKIFLSNGLDNLKLIDKILPFELISFHNPKDEVIPIERGINFFEHARAEKKLFIRLEKGNHNDFDMKLVTDKMLYQN